MKDKTACLPPGLAEGSKDKMTDAWDRQKREVRARPGLHMGNGHHYQTPPALCGEPLGTLIGMVEVSSTAM